MKNLSQFKKEIFLLSTGLLLVALAIFSNFNPSWIKILGSEKITILPTPTPDPSKDLTSLDNFITYQIPSGWRKSNQIDIQNGQDTFIKLTSPDFSSATPSNIDSGVGIVIDRTYDLTAATTLKNKLNATYGFDTYNVMPIKIAEKDALTMHQDKEEIHHRFIYIASGNHLWEISISSKTLEDEEKYQGDINSFIDSIKFKN